MENGDYRSGDRSQVLQCFILTLAVRPCFKRPETYLIVYAVPKEGRRSSSTLVLIVPTGGANDRMDTLCVRHIDLCALSHVTQRLDTTLTILISKATTRRYSCYAHGYG